MNEPIDLYERRLAKAVAARKASETRFLRTGILNVEEDFRLAREEFLARMVPHRSKRGEPC